MVIKPFIAVTYCTVMGRGILLVLPGILPLFYHINEVPTLHIAISRSSGHPILQVLGCIVLINEVTHCN